MNRVVPRKLRKINTVVEFIPEYGHLHIEPIFFGGAIVMVVVACNGSGVETDLAADGAELTGDILSLPKLDSVSLALIGEGELHGVDGEIYQACACIIKGVVAELPLGAVGVRIVVVYVLLEADNIITETHETRKGHILGQIARGSDDVLIAACGGVGKVLLLELRDGHIGGFGSRSRSLGGVGLRLSAALGYGNGVV